MFKNFKKCCNRESGVFILRIVLGIIFLAHGGGKFLDTAGGVAAFSQAGLSSYWFYTIATIESLGGALLLVGLFVRYTSLVLALITAFFAIYAKVIPIFKQVTDLPPDIHIPFFLFKSLVIVFNTEIDLVLVAATLCLFLGGAAKWSLASKCKCKCHHGEKMCGICKVVGCADIKDSKCCSCSPHHTNS